MTEGRTHTRCVKCRQPIDEGVAHCSSKHCPWCITCARSGLPR